MKKLLMLLFSAAFLMLAGCDEVGKDEVGKTDNQTPGGGKRKFIMVQWPEKTAEDSEASCYTRR